MSQYQGGPEETGPELYFSHAESSASRGGTDLQLYNGLPRSDQSLLLSVVVWLNLTDYLTRTPPLLLRVINLRVELKHEQKVAK